MLQVSISGSMPELAQVFALLARIAGEIETEATDITHHLTNPKITAASTGAPVQTEQSQKPDRRRKEYKNAAPAAPAASSGGPFTEQQQQQPLANGTASPPSYEDTQNAISKMFAKGKGGSVPGLLSNFSIEKCSDLAEDRRAAFIAAAERIIAE